MVFLVWYGNLRHGYGLEVNANECMVMVLWIKECMVWQTME